MSDLPNPINRYEKYLNAIATGNSDDLPTPITREEVFLDYIARNGGGGGGGDVTGVKGNAESNYRKGNVNITPENLGLGNVNNTSDANKPVSTAQQTALDSKVDKVIGKGLSANDYTDADKAIVDGVTSALAGKASTNDLGDKSNLTTTDKSSAVGAINEVNYGLNNIMKVPNQGADVLGYGAKDGSNAVTVNLGSNNIANYDFLEFLISYYDSGIASYGYIIIPTSTMQYIFGGDAGVPMFVVTTVNSVGSLRVVLNGNSNVKFSPDYGIEPQGNYYVVRGVKLRK